MAKSGIIGLVAGSALVVYMLSMGGNWRDFLDAPSFVIVIGGTAAALLTSYSISDFKKIGPVLKELFTRPEPDLHQYIERFGDLIRTSRRDGILSLESQITESKNSLMRLGLELAIDGIEEDHARKVLNMRIQEEMQKRHLTVKVLNSSASLAPAFGMIGTLIGLIQMLQHMSNPEVIGPAMAVAIITTFYGALLANLFFLPACARVKVQTAYLIKEAELIREGILGMIRGDTPSVIEHTIQSLIEGEPLNLSRLKLARFLAKAA